LVSNFPVFVSIQEFLILFSSPVLLRRGSERVAGWASGSQTRSTHHKKLRTHTSLAPKA